MTTLGTASTATRATLRGDRVRSILRGTPIAQAAAVTVLAVVAVTTIPGFLTRSSIYSVLILAAFLGIAAAGQTLVILLGGIDISVPAFITGTNLMAPVLVGKGMPVGVAIAVVLLASALLGGAQGYLIRRFELSPLVFTLAIGAIVTGVTLAWSHAGALSGNIPTWLSSFSAPIGHTLGIPVPPIVVLWALLAMGLGIMLHRTVAGRHVYATAANERAASLAGVKTLRIWIGVFALSALSAGTLGVLLDGFVGAPTANVGSPYLFTSLTAVMVGGTSLVGGRGDYSRTVLGALIVELITTLLVSKGASAGLQQLLFGLLVLGFVGLYGRDRRVGDRV